MKLTGGEIVVKYLEKEGIRYVMGIPGHGCLGLTDALRKSSIEVIQVKQEMAGVHMAEAYYRVTGRPLAVFTSIGPGAINTAIGLANAYVDSLPVLVIAGDAHTHMSGKGVLQEIERQHDSNFSRVMEPIVKRYWKISEVGQLPSVMHRAFNQMLTGRRGPVLISLPMNVQCDMIDTELPKPVERQPSSRAQPDPKDIRRAAKLLASAERPVILVYKTNDNREIAVNNRIELQQLALKNPDYTLEGENIIRDRRTNQVVILQDALNNSGITQQLSFEVSFQFAELLDRNTVRQSTEVTPDLITIAEWELAQYTTSEGKIKVDEITGFT